MTSRRSLTRAVLGSTQALLLIAVILGPRAEHLAAICPCSLWSASSAPTVADSQDLSSAELGVRFRSDVPGFVSGISFYKSAANVGPHTGSLWTTDGTLLATATFSGETDSGWQTVSFGSPVAVAANTTYIASYHTDSGHYAADAGGLSATVDNAPLHAPGSTSTSPNGLISIGSGPLFPTGSGNGTNYWVDVFFTVSPPSINTINPTKYVVGGTVKITGSHLSGTSAVAFNGASATFTQVSDSQVNAVVPDAARSGPVTVTTPGGTATGPTFSLKPKVSALNPVSGSPGTQVTITGTGFAEVSRINFYRTAIASFTIVDSHTIVATVPALAQTGQIQVIGPGGTALSAVFTVVSGPPDPNAFVCTHVLGFSQSSNWYNTGQFEKYVAGYAWEAQVPGGGNIANWADPNSFVWTTTINSPCSQGPVDRVMLNVGPTNDDQLANVEALTRQAIQTIRTKFPSVRQIILQAMIGGPGHATCYVNGQPVKSTVYHPTVDDTIARVVGGDVVAGTSPEVSSCSQFTDTSGHLTRDGSQYMASVLGSFYANFTG